MERVYGPWGEANVHGERLMSMGRGYDPWGEAKVHGERL